MKNTKNATIDKIFNDIDYIYYPRYNNSIDHFLKNTKNPMSDKMIAKCLLLDEEDKNNGIIKLNELYENAIQKIRQKMKVEV